MKTYLIYYLYHTSNAIAAAKVKQSDTQDQVPPTSAEKHLLRTLSDASLSSAHEGIPSDFDGLSPMPFSMSIPSAIGESHSKSGGTSHSSKSSKGAKSAKDRSITGVYPGFDTEDATSQNLDIFCNKGRCDIILRDARFSTCERIVPGTTGGIGNATDIPIDSLDDFTISLYCLQPGETEINYDNGPTANLTGDMLILPNGAIRRTGTGFYYSKTSLPEIRDVDGETIDINNESVNLNGRYTGVDFVDGSGQTLELVCTKKFCNIQLSDRSFSTCKESSGISFYSGIGIAKDVPRDSLDDFIIELYCLSENEFVIDPSRDPDAHLTGNLEFVRDGILRRPSRGVRYTKTEPLGTGKDVVSVYKDVDMLLLGTDTEDGSRQSLQLDCKDGLCDLNLQDSSFSTCIENLPGGRFLGGLATATGIPQDSLYDFEFELYCASNFTEGIDYNSKVANLAGNFVFLQDGIARRTATGFDYFNLFKQSKALTGRYGGGIIKGDGGFQQMQILCNLGMCEVIIWTNINRDCIVPSGRFLFGGIAVNNDVPEDSLEDFGINLYCVPPGPGSEIDLENQDPFKTIAAKVVPDDSTDGIVHLTMDGDEYKLFKTTSE